MSVQSLNFVLLLAEAALYFCVMAGMLRLRHRMGVGLFMSALGVMHFLETYLASTFYVELPFGILSPGSTVLFSGKLAMLLLLYIKEDAATVRQPIYGLLIANALVLALVGILAFQPVAQLANGRIPDIGFVQEMGWLMVWGTALLYIDALAIILCFEKLRRWFGHSLLARIVISTAAVLTFDQIGFYLVLRYLTDAPASLLLGGWAAKMCAAIFYSIAMVAYLHWVEKPRKSAPRPISDLFGILTYREKYEKLVQDVGRDGLTQLLHRGRFEPIATEALHAARYAKRPLSLLMIDIDHFKTINDRHGHAEGDRAIQAVARLLAERTAESDHHAFRLGGEEFAVLAPATPAMAFLLAENIRLAIATSEFGKRLRLTVSIGVATDMTHDLTFADLYAEADQRLYEAKAGGRNTVVASVAESVARSKEAGSPSAAETISV